MNLDIEKIIREYVDKTIHMSLGTSRDNKPWVCEVHFVWDEDLNVYFRSDASRRHSQEIALNSHVAGNIVAQHQLADSPHGIYFEGTAAAIEDATERENIFPLFRDRQNKDESILAQANEPDGAKFYKITVENWYTFGRFGGEKNEKHQLVWNGGKK